MTSPRSSRLYIEVPAPESRQSGSWGHAPLCGAVGHRRFTPAGRCKGAGISLPAHPLLGTRHPALEELAICCLVQKRSCQRSAMTRDKVIPLGVPPWVTYSDSFICSAFTEHLLLPTSQLQASLRSRGRAHTLEPKSSFAPGMRRDPGLLT